MLGWKAPIWPVSGVTFNMRTSKKFRNTVYLNDSHPTYLTPIRENIYRVSSFYEFTDVNTHEVNPTKISFLQDRVSKVFNIKDAEFSDFWSCKRPVSSDDLPIISEFPGLSNVFINSGHGSRGSIFCLSSAELISYLVLGKSPLLDPRPFSASRFLL
jgi:glycine/D-amino acid oxidase-like deaminating enzyme